MFQDRKLIEPLVGFEQGLQLPLDVRGHCLLEQTDDALTFGGDDAADQVLEDGVARRHEAAGSQVLQHFSQNVDRLRRTHRDPPRFALQILLCGLATPLVIEKVEDDLLLLETGGFRQLPDRCQSQAGEMSFEDVAQIFLDFVTGVDKNWRFALK